MSEQEQGTRRTRSRSKARRPANADKRTLNITIGKSIYLRLGACADDRRMTRGQVVEEALGAYLTGYKVYRPGVPDGEDAEAG